MAKTEHEKMLERKNRAKLKGLSNLSPEQIKTLQKTYDTLLLVTTHIEEMQDLYLSDYEKLERAFWDLRWNFDLSPSEEMRNG